MLYQLYSCLIITFSGFSCQASPAGLETEPFLVFINATEINRVNIDGTNYQTIVTGLNNGVALDYDYNNDQIYWTDVESGKISATRLSNDDQVLELVSGTIYYLLYDRLLHGKVL